mmetsp:Transcript_8967/g.23474  ORF Transcript_8967/g.23474 Transcript_8967/m.23474 type:complete len:219 (-) Transcript_8967:88-744(-)
MRKAAAAAVRAGLSALGWIPVGAMFATCVGSVHIVTGTSMQPALNGSGDAREIAGCDVIALNRLAVRALQLPLERGDVVVFRDPQDPARVLMKRVVGLPGDEILPLQSGDDDAALQAALQAAEHARAVRAEQAASFRKPDLTQRLPLVKPGQLWVEGDNRDASRDSLEFGTIPRALVLGRVDAVLWPLNRARLLNPQPDLSRVIIGEIGGFVPRRSAA